MIQLVAMPQTPQENALLMMPRLLIIQLVTMAQILDPSVVKMLEHAQQKELLNYVLPTLPRAARAAPKKHPLHHCLR